jgi:hypothetical protein
MAAAALDKARGFARQARANFAGLDIAQGPQRGLVPKLARAF